MEITNKKVNILAKFFAKVRYENDPDLEMLFSLQDVWDDIYMKNRIKLSFQDAQILANEYIISKVLIEK
jgi:hypothetical protein